MMFLIAAAVLAADFGVKRWALAALKGQEAMTVLPGLLHLEYMENTGVAFGLLANAPIVTAILAIAAMSILYFALRRYARGRFVAAAFALTAGGFLGNLLDRALYGFVVDMIYFPFLPFFVCNIADIAITAGVVMLVFSLFLRPGDWKEKAHGTNVHGGKSGQA